MKGLLAAALFAAGISNVSATGLHRCDSGDASGWKTAAQLQQKLQSEGWKIRKIKRDGGCYEVYGTTPDGTRGEAYFHPITFELELIARRGKVIFRKGDD